LDQDVPFERTRQFFEKLQRQNSRAQFTPLPGVGHRCTQEVFEKFAVLDWLLQH
jgi:dipeptidyl aminopeptidase/acylaminoacyl peptidase